MLETAPQHSDNGPHHWVTVREPRVSALSQWPIAIANLFFAPAIGLFYFLILQGVAQGLNLGLDIYYELQPEDTPE